MVRGIELLKKIYVSPGHKIGIDKAYEIARKFMKYSLPEPIRQAHILANKAKRENENIQNTHN